MGEKSCEKCKERSVDGGPSGAMVCDHPDAPDRGYIISWVNDERRPAKGKCPKSKCHYTHSSLRAKGHQYCHSCGEYIRKK